MYLLLIFISFCIREKEKKLEELKSQKTEFVEGFWNVNTVLLGGLGKDPIIEGGSLFSHSYHQTLVKSV